MRQWCLTVATALLASTLLNEARFRVVLGGIPTKLIPPIFKGIKLGPLRMSP